MRSTTDEKVNSRVYWLSAFLSNKASNASGVSVLSKRLLDMTAKGVLVAKRSKTWLRSMASLRFLFTYLASLYTVIGKHADLGRDEPISYLPQKGPGIIFPLFEQLFVMPGTAAGQRSEGVRPCWPQMGGGS